MEYKATKEFAKEMDHNDPLEKYRNSFHFPKHSSGEEAIYLCGNSLGLQPKSAKKHIEAVLDDWRNLGVKGHFGYGPDEIIIEEGKITGLRVKKVLSIFDEDKRFNPKYDESDKIVIEATQVYIATGQMPEYAFFDEAMLEQVEITRGQVQVGKLGQFSSFPWLFAGGDIVQGPDIITGVANGHDAADGIDKYIRAKNK